MLLLVVGSSFFLVGCSVFRIAHKDFRGNGPASHFSVMFSTENRIGILVPGPISDTRNATIQFDWGSGSVTYTDKLRWLSPVYEFKLDTIPLEYPCDVRFFYLSYNDSLEKDVQRPFFFNLNGGRSGKDNNDILIR